MAQTKEDAQEKARKKKDSAEFWEDYAVRFHGRKPGDSVYVRCEWDTPKAYDERNPPGRAWSRYNYRLQRMEWSFAPIPPEFAADYEPQRTAVAATPAKTAPPPVPRRRFVLPSIDKVRGG